MHIELDVFEIGFLIFLVYAIKWVFRLLVLFIVGKIFNQIKQKGEEKLNGIKQGFEQFGKGKESDKNGSESN